MNAEPIHLTRLRIIQGLHPRDLLSILSHSLEVPGTPAHVILVLFPLRQEGAEVDESMESAMMVEIIEERKGGRGVSWRGEVFEEGDLHVCAR